MISEVRDKIEQAVDELALARIELKAVASELDVRRLARARPTQTFLKRRSTFTSKCSPDIFDNLDNSARFHEGASIEWMGSGHWPQTTEPA